MSGTNLNSELAGNDLLDQPPGPHLDVGAISVVPSDGILRVRQREDALAEAGRFAEFEREHDQPDTGKDQTDSD
jgi:hypothetical protein